MKAPVRRRRALCAAVLVASGLLVSCQTMEEVGRIYLRATPEGRKLLAKWDYYAEIAQELKKHHDQGQLGEEDVIAVLEAAGVIGRRPAPRPGAAPAPEPAVPRGAAGRGGWRWPLQAGVVSSEYGRRGARPHRGIDIAADTGEPIHAAAAGEVIYSDDRMSGYGNAVILRHADDTTSLYAHANTLGVRRGQRVGRGAVIGEVGSTGRSTGPHLHFEIRVAEAAVDPRSVLPKSRF